jgi:hypothetical protein
MLDILVAWGIIKIHNISENAPVSVFKCDNVNSKSAPGDGQIQHYVSLYNEQPIAIEF